MCVMLSKLQDVGDGTKPDETKQDLHPEARRLMCREDGQQCALRKPCVMQNEMETVTGMMRSTEKTEVPSESSDGFSHRTVKFCS